MRDSIVGKENGDVTLQTVKIHKIIYKIVKGLLLNAATASSCSN